MILVLTQINMLIKNMSAFSGTAFFIQRATTVEFAHTKTFVTILSYLSLSQLWPFQHKKMGIPVIASRF